MKKVLKYGIIVIIIIATIFIGINLYVKISTNKQVNILRKRKRVSESERMRTIHPNHPYICR